MKAESILPWIPVFPLLGFLLNGLLYLISHSKLGDKDAPLGAHGGGHEPHKAEVDGHGLTHSPAHATADAHGHGHAAEEHAHHEIPFARAHSLIGPISCGLSFVFSLLAIIAWWTKTHGEGAIVSTLWTWMPLGPNPDWFGGTNNISVDFAFQIDPLTALMIFFVTFIGTLIHVYSVGYMGHDPGYGRYFAYLNLFMFSMLLLVLGANLPMLFVGWEGVGLCSYLLIGFYYTKDWAANAGKKAFVVNRIGDFGFVLGILACLKLFGTTDFGKLFAAAAAHPERYAAAGLITATCLALFIGACGKSAQLPLYVWLPDAMAGPTPVSALIHAATMVTAGVYMVTRCNVLFRISHQWAVETLGPGGSTWAWLTHDASLVVAVVGAATAIFAASMGLAQTDIKKVLAYSTVSQLGYMFLACGVLAFGAGMFHVFTHAWFKACLFLGSGSVIHALAGEQEMTKMGGLKKLIPVTFLTMGISTLAISGFPLLAGFFSKDAILGETFAAGHPALWLVGVATAGLTAFYMFRLMKMTFFGEFRGTKEQLEHVHESPATMTIPLWILAGGAVVTGFLGLPRFIFGEHANLFERFLEPIFLPLPAGWQSHPHHVAVSTEWMVMLVSIAVAGVGMAVGWFFYSGSYPFATPERISAAVPRLYRWIRDKYYVDEFYDWLFVNGLIKKGGKFLWEVDARVIDGVGVHGARNITVGLSHLSNWFDRTFVDGAVNGVADTLQAAFRGYRRLQSGRTQSYAMAMAAGVFGLVCIYLILQ